MSELRLTGKSPDGTRLLFTNQEGEEFSVRISDSLRATINQPRLSSVSSDSEDSPISVAEIQRRLRSGESVESIARDGRATIEKINRFSGPILQERLYILSQVHQTHLRKDPSRGSQDFLQVVQLRLANRGVDTEEITWNTWRIDDLLWDIELTYPTRDGSGVANWSYDATRRALTPLDDNARWALGEEPISRISEPGLIYSELQHPSRATERVTETIVEVETIRETPRLVAIRETPAPEDARDGITGRAKVPSWDEIMFGRAAEKLDSQNDEDI